MDLFSQPKARVTDPGTSHMAAAKLDRKKVNQLMAVIIDVLFYQSGKTDEEIGHYLSKRGIKFSPSGLRTRRSELVRAGIIEAYGTKENSLGNPCQIWRLTEVGDRAKDYLDNYGETEPLTIGKLIEMGEEI